MAAIARLKRRAEFLRVAGGRQKWVTPGLILQAWRHPDESGLPPGPRIGYTTSRKVGIAVIRNRARRRLRAAVDQVLTRHAAPGHDYVVIGRAGTVQRPFPALLGDLETALRRLRVWHDRPADER